MLSFSQKQFANLIRNLPSVTQPVGLSLQCLSPLNSFSLQLSLRQLTSLYFKTQRAHKFHNCYRHLKYKCYQCIVVPPLVTLYSKRLTFRCCHPMSVTQLLLCMDLPFVVRRCLVLPLLPIRCPWFVVWSRCFHRNVASIDEMTQHCVIGTQNWFESHHTTSHHITSHNITSLHTTLPHFTHHITSHNITSLQTSSLHNTTLPMFRCKMCTQSHKTSLCSHSREQTKHF